MSLHFQEQHFKYLKIWGLPKFLQILNFANEISSRTRKSSLNCFRLFISVPDGVFYTQIGVENHRDTVPLMQVYKLFGKLFQCSKK